MGKSRTNRGAARKKQLREDAEDRQAHRQSISNEEQVQRLNERLGEDQGASKERVRLWHLIEEEKAEQIPAERRGGKKNGNKTQ